MPERMSEYMPESMPDRMSGCMPERMLDRISECLPERMFDRIYTRHIYMHVSEMLCVFQRCCARVGDVAHISQKLCMFHKPPKNVRVQPHWGDQTRSPDMPYIPPNDMSDTMAE